MAEKKEPEITKDNKDTKANNDIKDNKDIKPTKVTNNKQQNLKRKNYNKFIIPFALFVLAVMVITLIMNRTGTIFIKVVNISEPDIVLSGVSASLDNNPK